MSRVTVIGAGFGALNAVRALRKADRKIGIDLIAPKPVFMFWPGTIWIPSEDRQPESFEVPLDRFFERFGVDYRRGRVMALENAGRRVRTGNEALDNDGLIIAAGATFEDRPDGRQHTFLPCGGIEEMARLRDRLRQLDGGTLAFGFAPNSEEPGATRGGPVFELLFGIETWLRRNRKRDRFRLVLFSPARRPGERLGSGAAKRLHRHMRERDIEIRTDERPERFEADRVVTDRDELHSDLTVYMPGLAGPEWFGETGLSLSPGGLLQADRRCRAEGVSRVYVVGDAGSFSGPDWVPKRGHAAESQAKAAARNLVDELDGRKPSRRFRPDLVCVIDTLDKGMLIVRSERVSFATPALRPIHWAKRAFEWNYKRRFSS
ncbi:MAG: NAD(P)/FAD-dependent oxidoreductase [Candidatus Wenzhouxiangella sp. M2_3B_020]